MIMKKHIMVLFVCVLLLFTMVGCTKSESVTEEMSSETENSAELSSETENNAELSEENCKPEQETEEIKVLLSELYDGKTIVTYEYDERGNCIKKTDSDGSSIEYLYDENDLCIKETHRTDWYKETAEYEYDEDGDLLKESLFWYGELEASEVVIYEYTYISVIK